MTGPRRNTLPRRRPGRSAIRLTLLLLGFACLSSPTAGRTPTRASIEVRTLVIDALGTRTVDTHAARVPLGHKGLLTGQVPYAGPPLSYRLAVTPGDPQPSGLPLTFTTEVWSGPASPIPPSERVSLREETTVLGPESSYLLELAHDRRTDRRLLLSIKARPITEAEELPPIPAPAESGRIVFMIEILRKAGDLVDPLDTHILSTFVGHPVSYRSGIEVPRSRATGGSVSDSGPGRVVGVSVVLTPERALGGLITVKLELTGADFIDRRRSLIEPFEHTEVRTVSSGSPFAVEITLPREAPVESPELTPVVYRVSITPWLAQR